MTVGVAICTLNRADRLERALGSLASVVEAGVPVLVVDNGSTDRTSDVIRSFSTRYLLLHSVLEPDVGLSNARNRALNTLETDYIAFLDDDVVVAPGWLDAVSECLRADCSPVGIAGRIDLSWERPRRTWSIGVPLVDAQLAGLDLGPAPRALLPDETPYGANMVLDRLMCLDLGGFRAHLGRRARSLMSMEEVDLVTRIRGATSRPLAWCPAARVMHVVPVERTTFRYHLRRAFAQGKSEEVLFSTCDGYRPSTDRPWQSVLHASLDSLKRHSRAGVTQAALQGAYASGRTVAKRSRLTA